MADEFDQSWRKKKGPTQRAPWQDQAAPLDRGDGGRRLKMGLLALAGTAIAGGIAWLIYLLTGNVQPGLMTFADAPRSTATELHRPYDPFGYASAEWLLKWMQAQHVGDPLAPKPIDDKPSELRQFDEWIGKIDKKYNPVVLYFGLPSRVDGTGEPCLVTLPKDPEDPFPQSIKVSEILDRLGKNDLLKKKQLTLVFDNGREMPDPNRGEFESHFAEAMKHTIGPKLAEYPNVTIILGADAGQIGGESPATGITPVAKSLADAMYPMQPSGVRYRVFGPGDFFSRLREDVTKWAGNNRPTPQTPVMMPEGPPTGLRAKEIFYRRPADKPYVDVPSRRGEPYDLQATRLTGDEFVKQRVPVAAYTPAAWRQYREWSLRLEHASLAGDEAGRNVLLTAIDKAKETIVRGLDLKVSSADYSLAMPLALGRPAKHAAADPTNGPISLKAAAERANVALADGRPVESHLAVMMQHYVEKRRPGFAFADWKQPIETRRLAERAATALQAKYEFPYAEAVWPRIASTVLEGDGQRRQAEDLAFHKPIESAPGFAAAKAKYEAALKAAEPLQRAIALRDRAMADLPYWGRWAAEANQIAHVNDIVDAWQLTHRLAVLIEKPGIADTLLNEASTKLEAILGRLTKALADDVAVFRANADTTLNVTQWGAIQPLLLLPPGLLSAADRTMLTDAVRKFNDFSEAKDKKDSFVVSGAVRPDRDPKRTHRRRLIAAMFGSRDSLVALKELQAGPWPDEEFTVGMLEFQATSGSLARKSALEWRSLADPFRLPLAGVEDAEAKRLVASRIAIPLAKVVEEIEPAVRIGRERWRIYLEAMARRIATDHWYDERDQSYFAAKIATAMLADADTIQKVDPPSADRAAIAALIKLDDKPLKIQWANDRPGTVRRTLWTNETKKSLGYQLTPYALTGGQAVVWPSAGGEGLAMFAMTQGPSLAPVDAAISPSKPIEIECRPMRGQAIPQANLAVVVEGTFRGRVLRAESSIAIRRTPDYVATEIRDPQRQSVLAIRSGNDFDAGSLAIVLDFSGSMAFTMDGKVTTVKEQQRKWKMLKSLETLLKQIPPQTELTVRCFYEREDKPDMRTFGPMSAESFLQNSLADLKGIEPSGPTPLIATIEQAVTRDLRDREDREGREHTVVVLTDGTDNSLASDPAYASRSEKRYAGSEIDNNYAYQTEQKLRDKNRKDKNDAFLRETIDAFRERTLKSVTASRTRIGLHVILFGKDENADAAEASRKIFAPLNETYRRGDATEYYGRFYEADQEKDLTEALIQALRPKPRLTEEGGQAIDNSDRPGKKSTFIPPSGLPTNVVAASEAANANEQFANMWWWGYLDNKPQDYKLRFGSSFDKNAVRFDNGLNLFLRLARDRNGLPAFTRELYYKDVDQRLSAKVPTQTDDSHPDWHLAVVQPAVDTTGDLASIIAAFDDKRDRETLRPAVPELMWWDLTVGPKADRFTKPVHVRNITRLHAPCWQTIGQGLIPGGSTYGVRTVAVRESELTSIRVGNPFLVGRPKLDGLDRFVPAEDGLTIRLSMEPYDFAGQSSSAIASILDLDATLPPVAQGLKPCLIVRIEDDQGRRLRAGFKNTKLQKLIPIVEHQYFYDEIERNDPTKPKPKVRAYSAIFGPMPAPEEYEGDIEIVLYDLGVDEKKLKPLAVSNLGLVAPTPIPAPNAQKKPVAK